MRRAGPPTADDARWVDGYFRMSLSRSPNRSDPQGQGDDPAVDDDRLSVELRVEPGSIFWSGIPTPRARVDHVCEMAVDGEDLVARAGLVDRETAGHEHVLVRRRVRSVGPPGSRRQRPVGCQTL
jgi:hypothetical protein